MAKFKRQLAYSAEKNKAKITDDTAPEWSCEHLQNKMITSLGLLTELCLCRCSLHCINGCNCGTQSSTSFCNLAL